MLLFTQRDLRQKVERLRRRSTGRRGWTTSRWRPRQIDTYEKAGFGTLPVCIADTPLDSRIPSLKGAPTGLAPSGAGSQSNVGPDCLPGQRGHADDAGSRRAQRRADRHRRQGQRGRPLLGSPRGCLLAFTSGWEGVRGFGWLVVAVGLLLDLSSLGAGRRARRMRSR